MQFRYRLSKFSWIGVVVVILGVSIMLVSYTDFHRKTETIQNQQSKEQPKLRKSFSEYKTLGADSAEQEKKLASAKSTFRYSVGAGLFIVVIGSAIMAIPARNWNEPRRTAKPTKPTKSTSRSGSRRRREVAEEENTEE